MSPDFKRVRYWVGAFFLLPFAALFNLGRLVEWCIKKWKGA